MCIRVSNIMHLYKSLVRPHIEYRCQAWRLYLQQDIDNVEKVQTRAIRMIPSISSFSHEEILDKCGILCLEMRRLHSDLTFVFKMISVEAGKFFKFQADPCTRSHNL